MQPKCLCGLSMDARSRCPVCGVEWKHDQDGHWAEGFRAVIFTPKFTKRKLNHYQRYMRWRRLQKRRLM